MCVCGGGKGGEGWREDLVLNMVSENMLHIRKYVGN